MSWKRAQIHAESMLVNLGVAPQIKGRKDLRGKKLVLVDDGTNPYRTMCFTVAAKIVKRRGGAVETAQPRPGEAPYAKIISISQPPQARRQRPTSKGPA
jgi:hypothetical protein